jgi:hypothetical protein
MFKHSILERPEPARREDFWARVHKAGADDCWNWSGGRSSDGYGVHKIRRYYRTAAHRIAYALANQEEPGDFHVCHRCDNPVCCNPAHLFLGTAADNAQDKVQKGRARGRFSA